MDNVVQFRRYDRKLPPMTADEFADLVLSLPADQPEIIRALLLRLRDKVSTDGSNS